MRWRDIRFEGWPMLHSYTAELLEQWVTTFLSVLLRNLDESTIAILWEKPACYNSHDLGRSCPYWNLPTLPKCMTMSGVYTIWNNYTRNSEDRWVGSARISLKGVADWRLLGADQHDLHSACGPLCLGRIKASDRIIELSALTCL